MKTLYVSDLDGTLLNREPRLSAYTAETLNLLIEEGLPFTYATARSVHSARIVAAGLQTRLPVITYNGVFLQDAQTGKVLSRTVFSPEEVENLAGYLSRHPVSALACAVGWRGARFVAAGAGERGRAVLSQLTERGQALPRGECGTGALSGRGVLHHLYRGAGCAFAALQCGAGRHALFCNVPAGALPGGILAGDHAGKGYQGAWHPQALRAAGV